MITKQHEKDLMKCCSSFPFATVYHTDDYTSDPAISYLFKFHRDALRLVRLAKECSRPDDIDFEDKESEDKRDTKRPFKRRREEKISYNEDNELYMGIDHTFFQEKEYADYVINTNQLCYVHAEYHHTVYPIRCDKIDFEMEMERLVKYVKNVLSGKEDISIHKGRDLVNFMAKEKELAERLKSDETFNVDLFTENWREDSDYDE